MLIDTHAHLNFPDYRQNLSSILDRANEAGVKKIICVSSSTADSQKAVELSAHYPKAVYASVGVHPQEISSFNKQKLEKLAKGTISIGECGLDYQEILDLKTQKKQKEVFEAQIKLSQKLKLPLIIHSRKAFSDTLAILGKYSHLKGVFHCYSAGKKGIEKVLAIGFYFGIDGNLTYDAGLQAVVSQIPLEKIVLETDSPFLSPEPFRDQTNEPARLVLTAQCLAKIKHLSLKEVSQITSQNSQNLFGL